MGAGGGGGGGGALVQELGWEQITQINGKRLLELEWESLLYAVRELDI